RRYRHFGPLRPATEEQPEFRRLDGLRRQEVMSAQILRPGRRAASLEVARRRAEHRGRGPQGAVGDRRIVRGLRAERNIPAAFRANTIERHFQRNVREILQEARHERSQEQAPVYRVGHDAKRSARRRMQLRDCRPRGVTFFSHASGMRIKQPSGRGEGKSPRRALEEPNPERLLQVGDCAAHRRFGDPQGARGGREAVEIDDLRQDSQLCGCPELAHARCNPPKVGPYCFTRGARTPGFQMIKISLPVLTHSRGNPMKISVHAMSVELLANTLTNLSHLLEKGHAHAVARKYDPALLLAARLAPDMFPLTRQVQIASDMCKFGVSRLAGVEAPKFEDKEQSFEELRARAARTIDFIKGVPAGTLEGSEDRVIKVALRDRTLEFKGLDYLARWVIPNVFFHVTTAYTILRHAGVELGKNDFLTGSGPGFSQSA